MCERFEKTVRWIDIGIENSTMEKGGEPMLKCPESVLQIIRTLENAGYEAWAVGGCVRDALLSREPDDWDITTSALPSVVNTLFEKTIPTGMKHGTVSVMQDGELYEVTTYRTEKGYSDRRRPDSVEFVTDIDADLARRDFTINAMAWHPERGFRDCYGGLNDLKDGILRAVGNPQCRFEEDALRMLRAVRFSAQLDFAVEPETLAAIQAAAESIRWVSSERVYVELNKWLLAPHSNRWSLFLESGLMAEVLPELEHCFSTPQENPWHIRNVGEHSLMAASVAPFDRIIRWTLLLHDIGKALTRTTDEHGIDHFYGHEAVGVDLARSVLERLRFDTAGKERILHLIRHHDRSVEPGARAVRRAVSAIGPEYFEDWMTVRRCDLKSHNPLLAAAALETLDAVEAGYRLVLEAEQCLTLKQLAVGGTDLIAMGCAPGPEMGILLNRLLEWVLEEPERNTDITLKNQARLWLLE